MHLVYRSKVAAFNMTESLPRQTGSVIENETVGDAIKAISLTLITTEATCHRDQ